MSKVKPQVIDDEEHERVHDRVAAVDVAKDAGVVCTRTPHPSRPGARRSAIWTVKARMNTIRALGRQLKKDGIEMVTLESTSDYWRIWFFVLEACGLAVQLVNASQAKNLPGPARNGQAGRAVAGPADRDGPAARVLRAAQGDPGPAGLHPGPRPAGPRADPVLAAAGKAAGKRPGQAVSVASKLTTVSAQDMIKAMIAGQRDPRVLAALARTGMKAKHDELVEALDGMFDDHHGELAALLLDQIAVLDGKITQLDARIEQMVAAIPAAWGINADGTTGPEAGTGPDAAVLPAAARLAEIPGVSQKLARAIIAETGLDMTRFPTAGHLVSWAGLCPSARQSGPRTRAGKKGQGNTWLRGQPRPGRHRRRPHRHLPRRALPPDRPPPRQGQGPGRRRPLHPGHHLAPARHPAARYTDLGPGYYQARTDIDRKLRNHIRQIEALGFDVTITKTD